MADLGRGRHGPWPFPPAVYHSHQTRFLGSEYHKNAVVALAPPLGSTGYSLQRSCRHLSWIWGLLRGGDEWDEQKREEGLEGQGERLIDGE